MIQPGCFVDPKYTNKLCKLQKSIYGLKQISCSQNMCFDEVVRLVGFIKSEEEFCERTRMSPRGGVNRRFKIITVKA